MTPKRAFFSEKIGSLSRFPDGMRGTVVNILAEPDLQGRLMGMGLFVGTRFQLLRGNGTSRNIPLLLAIGETRIAVDHHIAEMILVEP